MEYGLVKWIKAIIKQKLRYLEKINYQCSGNI